MSVIKISQSISIILTGAERLTNLRLLIGLVLKTSCLLHHGAIFIFAKEIEGNMIRSTSWMNSTGP